MVYNFEIRWKFLAWLQQFSWESPEKLTFTRPKRTQPFAVEAKDTYFENNYYRFEQKNRESGSKELLNNIEDKNKVKK